MRYLTAALLASMLTACMPAVSRFYLPDDKSLASEGVTCGFMPWGHVRIRLAEGVTASVSLIPKNGVLAAKIGLSISTGTTVRFSKPEVRFTDISTGKELSVLLEGWRVSVYGRDGHPGYFDNYAPDALLEGRGRNADLAGKDTAYLKTDNFESGATIEAPAVKELVMTLPTIEINGTAVQSKPILLRLIEKAGVMSLCT